MRMIVFFDLPVTTSENRRNYTKFRKFLIRTGFVMMQESVYCRMVLNQNAAAAIADKVRRERPAEGVVQLLTITEKQFLNMEYITGNSKSDCVDSDERLVIL